MSEALLTLPLRGKRLPKDAKKTEEPEVSAAEVLEAPVAVEPEVMAPLEPEAFVQSPPAVVVDPQQAERMARRAALGTRAWIVPKYDHPNPQNDYKRMEVGKAIPVDLDGWAHNQIEAGFFTIVKAPEQE